MANARIFYDQFNEPITNVELNSHTPDVGTSWTRVHQTGGETIKALASTDSAKPTDQTLSRGAAYTADATYTVADYQVFAKSTLAPAGSDDYLYLRVRHADSSNYYQFKFTESTSGDPTIQKRVAGVNTDLAPAHDNSDTVPFTDGVTTCFECVGTELTAYAGEIGYIYVTDAALSSAGKAALGMGASEIDTGGDTTADQEFDDFEVYLLDQAKTAWSNPTTTGETSNTFTNPTNAYSSNNSHAVANAAGDKQDYGDFGLSGIVGTIYGIQVKVEANVDGATQTFGVELSWDNGTTWTTQKVASWSESTDYTIVYGHARSLWGRAWSASEFSDANFRIRLHYVTESSTLREVNIDHVQVRVWYSAISAAVTGTITPSSTEADIVAGGKTIIVTLTGDTWVTAGATFDGQRQNIINGLDAAASPANGWNVVVQGTAAVTDVVRTSDTVATITLEAFATYDISSTETITVTVPSTAVTAASAITASPTFTITAIGGTAVKDTIGMGILPFAR